MKTLDKIVTYYEMIEDWDLAISSQTSSMVGGRSHSDGELAGTCEAIGTSSSRS